MYKVKFKTIAMMYKAVQSKPQYHLLVALDQGQQTGLFCVAAFIAQWQMKELSGCHEHYMVSKLKILLYGSL